MPKKSSAPTSKPAKPNDPILLSPSDEIDHFELGCKLETLDEVRSLTVYPSHRIAVYPSSQAARERLEKQIVPQLGGVEIIDANAEYVESDMPGDDADDDDEVLEAVS
jgi:hypothetical protein